MRAATYNGRDASLDTGREPCAARRRLLRQTQVATTHGGRTMNRHTIHQLSISAGALSRRVALRGAAGTGLAVALLAATRPPGVQAQATPGSATEGATPPNHFMLGNGETQITYDTGAVTGESQLTYQGPI